MHNYSVSICQGIEILRSCWFYDTPFLQCGMNCGADYTMYLKSQHVVIWYLRIKNAPVNLQHRFEAAGTCVGEKISVHKMYLTEEWLEYERMLGFRPQITGTAEEIRSGYQAICASIGEKLPPHDPTLKVGMLLYGFSITSQICPRVAHVFKLEDRQISGNVSVRIYTPKEATSTRKLPLGI